jgi:hypothetical protein
MLHTSIKKESGYNMLGTELVELFGSLFGGEAPATFSTKWVRIMGRGESTDEAHADDYAQKYKHIHRYNMLTATRSHVYSRYTCICTHTHTHTQNVHTQNVHTHTHVHTHVHTHTHTHTHTHSHTHTHTHSHTHHSTPTFTALNKLRISYTPAGFL